MYSTTVYQIIQSKDIKEPYLAGSISVPGDYDGDGKMDISIKDASGYWRINYAKNGFGAWDVVLQNYGNSIEAVPAPADYDGDGKADLSIKDAYGYWRIDYANNGYGSWDVTVNLR